MGKKKFKTSKKSVTSKGFNGLTSEDALDLQNQFAEMFKQVDEGKIVDFNQVQEESERAAEAGYNSVMADVLGALTDDDTAPNPKPHTEYTSPSEMAAISPYPFMDEVEQTCGEDADAAESSHNEDDELGGGLIGNPMDPTVPNKDLLNALTEIPGINSSLKKVLWNLGDMNNQENLHFQQLSGYIQDAITAIQTSIYGLNIPCVNEPTSSNGNDTQQPKVEDIIGSSDRPFAGLYQNENGWWNPKTMTLSVSDGQRNACSLDLSGASVDAILYRYTDMTSKGVSEWQEGVTSDDIVDINDLIAGLELMCIYCMSPVVVMDTKKFIDKFSVIQNWHDHMCVRFVHTGKRWGLTEDSYIMIYLIDRECMRDDLANMISRAMLLGKPYTFSKILMDYITECGFQFGAIDIPKFLNDPNRDTLIDDIANRLSMFGKPMAMPVPDGANSVSTADGYLASLVRNGGIIMENSFNKVYDKLDGMFDKLAYEDEDSAGNVDDEGNLIDPMSGPAPESDEDEEAVDSDSESLDEDDEEDEPEDTETVYSDPGSLSMESPFNGLKIPDSEVDETDAEDVEEPEDVDEIPEIPDVDLANDSLPPASNTDEEKPRYVIRPRI